MMLEEDHATHAQCLVRLEVLPTTVLVPETKIYLQQTSLPYYQAAAEEGNVRLKVLGVKVS